MVQSSPDESEWAATFHDAVAALTSFDYRTAAEGFRRAVELADRLHPGGEPLAESLEGLAWALTYAGESADVSRLLIRASELRLKLLAEKESTLGPESLAVAECLDRLAHNCRWQNDASEAIACYQRAVEIRAHALGENHYDVAATLDRMAEVYSTDAQYKNAATQHWQRAVAILDRLQENPETRSECVTNLLRVIMERLGFNAYEQDDDDTAETWFRRVAEVTSKEYGSLGCAPIFARVLIRRHKFAEAEIVLDAASTNPMSAVAWKEACKEALIDVYNATGRQDEAESLRKGA